MPQWQSSKQVLIEAGIGIGRMGHSAGIGAWVGALGWQWDGAARRRISPPLLLEGPAPLIENLYPPDSLTAAPISLRQAQRQQPRASGWLHGERTERRRLVGGTRRMMTLPGGGSCARQAAEGKRRKTLGAREWAPTHSYAPLPTLPHTLTKTTPTLLCCRRDEQDMDHPAPLMLSHIFSHYLPHSAWRQAQPTPHTYPHLFTLRTSLRREAGPARPENDDEWAGRLWREMQGRRQAAAQAQAAGAGGRRVGEECEV